MCGRATYGSSTSAWEVDRGSGLAAFGPVVCAGERARTSIYSLVDGEGDVEGVDVSIEIGPAARVAGGIGRASRSGIEKDLRTVLRMAENCQQASTTRLEEIDHERFLPVTSQGQYEALVDSDQSLDELDRLIGRVWPVLNLRTALALAAVKEAEQLVGMANLPYPRRVRAARRTRLLANATSGVRRGQIALKHLRLELTEPRVSLRLAVQCRLYQARRWFHRRWYGELPRRPRRFSRIAHFTSPRD